MSRPRFYYQTSEQGFQVASVLELSAGEVHHALKVLRLRSGTEVEVFDGCGNAAECVITEISKQNITLKVESIRSDLSSGLGVSIAFAPAKSKRLLTAIEQMVELGVVELIPLKTNRSVSLGGALAKWRTRAVEACKQSGNNFAPVIRELTLLPDLLSEFRQWDLVCLASLSKKALQPVQFAENLIGIKKILWLIGPEGGFSETEEMQVLEQGAIPIRLAENILRTGTALALAAGIPRFFACK